MPIQMKGVDTLSFDTHTGGGSNKSLGLIRDMRPFKLKYAMFFETILPLVLACFFFLLGFAVKAMSFPFMVISLLMIVVWRTKRKRYLIKSKSLFDEPKYLKYNKKASYEDYSPKEVVSEVKKAAPGVGKGVFFLGHEIKTHQEIHLDDGKFRTHIVLFGTTGSGKTENILSLCVNFLTQASGFILVDGKGDTLLFAKVFSLCRAFNRTDDLLLLNFMDSGHDREDLRMEKLTNTFNFFVDSTEVEANEIVGGLLPNESGGGGGLWEGRAASGIGGLNESLYYLKKHGYLEIDPDSYREYFELEKFASLAVHENIPDEYKKQIRSVLASVNYKYPTEQEPNPKQSTATEEQFQYITMQYTETFNMLAGHYRHITVSQVPDISIVDVVLRRRILLILLPSLAKAPQSVRNLGRIIIAMARNVSSKAIGSRVEGDVKTVIEGKPTAALSSFGMIFDEYGTYSTEGAQVLPAQVRSLNIVCVFAGQDYTAFQKGGEDEAATIFANCTIKICMKLEDTEMTFKKFQEAAGEERALVNDTFERKDSLFKSRMVASRTARVETRSVLEVSDMKDLGTGEEVVMYGAKVHRLKAFYADAPMASLLRVNHMLEVKPPSHSTVMAMREGVTNAYRSLKERITGDWEREESKVKQIHRSGSSSFGGAGRSLVNMVERLNKGLGGENRPYPDETQFANFFISVYLRSVEIVDQRIVGAINRELGVDDDDSEFDDDSLLASAILPGWESSKMLKDESESGSSSGQRENALTPDKIKDEPKPKEDVASPGEEFKWDEAIFDKIEKQVDHKRARLTKAEEASFNSLEAINLSVFDMQKSIQGLEEVLLLKEGRSKQEASKLSQLRAENLVLEMGVKTNVAIVSESEKKKTPMHSAQQVKGLISSFANSGRS
jgi:intracellular multiplication protein IcmO